MCKGNAGQPMHSLTDNFLAGNRPLLEARVKIECNSPKIMTVSSMLALSEQLSRANDYGAACYYALSALSAAQSRRAVCNGLENSVSTPAISTPAVSTAAISISANESYITTAERLAADNILMMLKAIPDRFMQKDRFFPICNIRTLISEYSEYVDRFEEFAKKYGQVELPEHICNMHLSEHNP